MKRRAIRLLSHEKLVCLWTGGYEQGEWDAWVTFYFYLELHFKGKTEEKDFENKFESVRGAGRKVARQDWKRTGH